MGTRSLTIIQDEKGQDITVMYRQMDGYPEGHGEELAEFLRGRCLVNGIQLGDKRNFNGLGCLAASVVAHFKKGIGEFYLHPAGTRDCWENYLYYVYPALSEGKLIYNSQNIMMRLERAHDNKILFDGSPDDFNSNSLEEEDEDCHD